MSNVPLGDHRPSAVRGKEHARRLDLNARRRVGNALVGPKSNLEASNADSAGEPQNACVRKLRSFAFAAAGKRQGGSEPGVLPGTASPSGVGHRGLGARQPRARVNCCRWRCGATSASPLLT
eukprot:15460506-Alexandrium_andersonii.AAC.1